jgi:hypothetical protein
MKSSVCAAEEQYLAHRYRVVRGLWKTVYPSVASKSPVIMAFHPLPTDSARIRFWSFLNCRFSVGGLLRIEMCPIHEARRVAHILLSFGLCSPS